MVAAQGLPLATSDAAHHPGFAPRPETGEEAYKSLLAVPIRRGGHVRGVLVLQHVSALHYSEHTVETLQTVAMAVAEVIRNGEIGGSGKSHIPAIKATAGMPVRLEGMPLNGGITEGFAVPHRPRLTMRQMVAEDPGRESERLDAALASMQRAIDDLVVRIDSHVDATPKEILETYRMIAADRGWLARMREAIDSGLTAEAAVIRVQEANEARRQAIVDPYLRERFQDFEDLANRLLLHLAGRDSVASSGTLPDAVVVVARSLGPAELLDYDPARLRGVILEHGSPTSHVAIVARALGIPVVGQCEEALATLEPLDPVIVDGEAGQVFVRPTDDIRATVDEAVAAHRRRQRLATDLIDRPPVSLDGVRVDLQLNAGLTLEVAHLDATGAEGIGLYRTEVPFMVRHTFPNVTEQHDLYRRVLDEAGDRPVTFRTLDAGGDKALPYAALPDEQNPALGWRAIRIGLDRPAMLRTQMRALLTAAGERPLRVMFPMVSEVAELAQVRALLDAEVKRCGAPSPIVGAMVEVPSLVWQIPQLPGLVDFLAVGSNDLAQYFFAADRGNARVAQRFDTLSPAFLEVLGQIVERATDAGLDVSVCGEMAGRPVEAIALLGLGFRKLSMAPSAFGQIKLLVCSVDIGNLEALIQPLRRSSIRSARVLLRAFARDHGLPL